AYRTPDDDIGESGKRQPLILFHETGDFRLDGRIGLAIEHAGRVPVNKSDECKGREREDRKINGDDSKRLGTEDLMRAHGSYNPRREPYAAAAPKNLCRFWRASERYAHQ